MPTTPDFTPEAREIVAGQQAARAAMEADYRAGRQVPRRYDLATGANAIDFPKVETVEACAARLAAEHEKREAFFASPRGRFLAAVVSLEGDFPVEGDRLRSAYSRSLADDREPLNLEEVARCLRILAPMDDQRAQEAELALADLLADAAPQFKAAA
jgi:hypothetical protein